jgi:hypothetical protein
LQTLSKDFDISALKAKGLLFHLRKLGQCVIVAMVTLAMR